MTRWGDYAYAQDLRSAFLELGHEAACYGLFQPIHATGRQDVLLRIAGPHLDDPLPEMPSIAWMISHAETGFPALFRRHDALFVPTPRMSELLAAHDVKADILPQATDTNRFTPDHYRPEQKQQDIIFVGNFNSLRGSRALILQAAELGLPLAVWGNGWQGNIPSHMLKGERLDPSELPRLYANSRIILNAHMGQMARFGMMSNRTYDGLAAGAQVICDSVKGFQTGTLPGLTIVANRDELAAAVSDILARPPADAAARRMQHDLIAQKHSFRSIAEKLIASARDITARRVSTRPSPPSRTALRAVIMTDAPCDTLEKECPGLSLVRTPQELAALPPEAVALIATPELVEDVALKTPVHLLLAPLQSQGGFASNPYTEHAIRITRIRQLHALRPDAIITEAGQEPQPLAAVLAGRWTAHCTALPTRPIHAVDRDHHDIIAMLKSGARLDETAQGPLHRAAALSDRLHQLRPMAEGLTRTATPSTFLARIFDGLPLFQSNPNETELENAKQHVKLMPLQETPRLARSIGVFLHLFHPEAAPIFSEALQRIRVPYRLYISAQTEAKAGQIRATFPDAEIRITPSCGADIYPRLFLFADAYDRHDIVLQLHCMNARNSDHLPDWLTHIIDSLLPNPRQVNRILSLFQDVDNIGMVAPVIVRSALSTTQWGTTYQVGREIARRLGQNDPPHDDRLRFPAGRMFWARSRAILPLIRLGLTPEDFPAETGQLDGNLVAALERMLGVTCAHEGFQQLFICPPKFSEFRRFRQKFTDNAELASWLKAGAAMTRR